MFRIALLLTEEIYILKLTPDRYNELTGRLVVQEFYLMQIGRADKKGIVFPSH